MRHRDKHNLVPFEGYALARHLAREGAQHMARKKARKARRKALGIRSFWGTLLLGPTPEQRRHYYQRHPNHLR